MSKPYRVAFRDFQVSYWRALYKEYDGNMTHIAEAAGVNRTSIYLIYKKLDLLKRNDGKKIGARWYSLDAGN
jgi:hypothetical protein